MSLRDSEFSLKLNERLMSAEQTLATMRAHWQSEFGGAGAQGNLYRHLDLMSQNINELKDELKAINVVSKNDFDSHIIADRWMFGILVTILIAIFTAVIVV